MKKNIIIYKNIVYKSFPVIKYECKKCSLYDKCEYIPEIFCYIENKDKVMYKEITLQYILREYLK